MGPDDRVCYCYGVTLRKLANYARRERPARASQMSDCLGAGTGCGWCIPFLEQIWADPDVVPDLEPEQYAAGRRAYIDGGEPRNSFDRASSCEPEEPRDPSCS